MGGPSIVTLFRLIYKYHNPNKVLVLISLLITYLASPSTLPVGCAVSLVCARIGCRISAVQPGALTWLCGGPQAQRAQGGTLNGDPCPIAGYILEYNS